MTAMPGLKNKIVAITRNARDAREFSHLVSEQGGRAIALPTIEIVPRNHRLQKSFLTGCKRKSMIIARS